MASISSDDAQPCLSMMSCRQIGVGGSVGSVATATMSRLRKACNYIQDLQSRSFAAASRSSDLTKEHSERIFQLLRTSEPQMDLSKLQTIQTLMNRCPRDDNFMEFHDDKGWNLLQKAIISNEIQVVSMLINKGCELNQGACSLPLHLACKLGHAQIVRLLLDNGARADLSRGLCYPVSHVLKPAESGRPLKFLCRQVRVPATPLSYAIPNDRDSVLKVLLTHPASKDIVRKDYLLHEVCQYRAKRCLRFVVNLLPEQVNILDKKQKTPLHHALKGPRNRESALLLLESQAIFSSEIFESEDGSTLLGDLYTSDDTTHLLPLTKLILSKGPADLATRINKQDGDTHLNKLLRHFGSSTPRDHDLYIAEVTKVIQVLVDHGCNPNTVNKRGEAALHCLLAHQSSRPLFYTRDPFHVTCTYLTRFLSNINKLLIVLLKHNSNPSLMVPPNVVSPLYYLMRIVCAMSPRLLSLTNVQVKQCMKSLCEYGADPNIINAYADNAMTLLLGSLSRWLFHSNTPVNGALDEEPTRLQSLLTFTQDALELFFEHKLDPQLVLRKNLKQFMIIYNSKILDHDFIQRLNELLRVVIRAGGNPNTLYDLHTNSYGHAKYTVMFYLARGLFIHCRHGNRRAFDMLNVLTATLDTPTYTQCLKAVVSELITEFEAGQQSILIQKQILNMFTEAPRTLKQLSRISIYKAINWKISENASKLFLPTQLVEYIKSVE